MDRLYCTVTEGTTQKEDMDMMAFPFSFSRLATSTLQPNYPTALQQRNTAMTHSTPFPTGHADQAAEKKKDRNEREPEDGRVRRASQLGCLRPWLIIISNVIVIAVQSVRSTRVQL